MLTTVNYGWAGKVLIKDESASSAQLCDIHDANGVIEKVA